MQVFVTQKRGRSIPRTFRQSMAALLIASPISAGMVGDAQAVDLDPHIERSTVRIFCPEEDGTSSGSGFLVGAGDHVITNRHVVGHSRGGRRCKVVDHTGGSVDAETIWSSERKDLAVLRLSTPATGVPVTFASRSTVDIGDPVVGAGFPGAADDLANIGDAHRATVTRGTLSRTVTSPTGVGYYQVDVPLNPGNSGGPLFNEFGQVIGVNAAKPQALVRIVGSRSGTGTTRIPQADGIAWAIQIEELLPALEELGISFLLDRSQPGYLERLWRRDFGLALMLTFLLLISATSLWMVVSQRRRTRVPSAPRQSDRPRQAAQPETTTRRPVLRALAGPLEGAVIELDHRVLAIGRDPRMANLLLPSEALQIGRRHCLLRFDTADGIFELDDYWSTNGTFLADGTRLEPLRTERMRPGAAFYLATPEIQFEVGVR